MPGPRLSRACALALSLVACVGTGPPSAEARLAARAAPNSLVTPTLSPRGRALRDSLDAYLRQQAARGFAGAVLVERAGEVVLHEGYGGTGNTPVSRGTGFWIGSVTKPLAATAILQLVSSHSLSLRDSLGGLFAQVPADKRRITVHQLLTHMSGIGERYTADGVVDRPAAIHAILDSALVDAPGTRYLYSNDNYTLLAAIIEMRSGLSYERYVRERLFAPAGMSESGLWGEPVPSTAAMAPVNGELAPAIARANWGFRGGTGIRSTVGDLYRWHLALRDSVVLSGTMQRLMYERHAPRSETRAYGYGWQVVGEPHATVLMHLGAESELEHYAGLIRGLDEPFVIAYLSNVPEPLALEVLGGVRRIVDRS